MAALEWMWNPVTDETVPIFASTSEENATRERGYTVELGKNYGFEGSLLEYLGLTESCKQVEETPLPSTIDIFSIVTAYGR